MSRIRTQEQINARYDVALQLAVEGLSLSQMAPRLEVKTPSQAMLILRSARASLVPAADGPKPRARAPLAVIGWAAGFFDGEGCVYGYDVVQSGYRRFMFGIAVAQVVRDPLDRLVDHWGGRVRQRPQTNPQHRLQSRWELRGAPAAAFLEDVLPYLVVKQEAALAALPVMFRTHRHGIAYSSAEIEERAAAVARLRELNRRGVVR